MNLLAIDGCCFFFFFFEIWVKCLRLRMCVISLNLIVEIWAKGLIFRETRIFVSAVIGEDHA